MNINGLIASFRGEALLADKKDVEKVKSVKIVKVKAPRIKTDTTREVRLLNQNKILKALKVKGGLTPLLIAEKAGLDMKTVYEGTKILFNNKKIKREFINFHWRSKTSGERTKSYSYALINDTSEPYNPRVKFSMSVLDELLKHESQSASDLIKTLNSTKYMVGFATDYLRDKGLVSVNVESVDCVKTCIYRAFK